jgi:energy-coupling factor transporter ATP-binding protein EcfA2
MAEAEQRRHLTVLDEVSKTPIGARFFRADLHIHSFGASHDVKDPSMTADAIVQTAAREGLSLIAITDHNEISNVDRAVQVSQETLVCVVPGIELSAPEGHLLCYLPTVDLLRRLHGQLDIADRGTQTSRCKNSLLECLNIIHTLGGFCVLAHVDISSGFETDNPGGSAHKADVLCHAALLGIELKHASSQISYAPGDPDGNRVQMGKQRIQRLKLGAKQFLARVLNSDAHAINAMGRNAANQQRVTRYKMDAPSFEGLRVALEDADARVRMEEDIPLAVPRILGVGLDGGFLSGQRIQFSPNLNCIIGGRGTGKSTAFEAARCIAHDASDSKVIDSEVWPDELHLFWEDQAGQRHCLLRRKEDGNENLDNPNDGPTVFEVDCFGQGEAARISYEAQSDPLALLRYLDKFVELSDPKAAEEAVREQLLTLQNEIENAERQVALIPQYERLLATTRQQLTALQKPGVKDLIVLQRQLATEKEIRKQIADKLREAKSGLGTGASKRAVEAIQNLADPTSLSVGATEFRAIVAGAATLEAAIGNADAQIKQGLSTFESLVTTQISAWKTRESEAQRKVDDKRHELEQLKVPFDMSYIAKLTKDEASHQQSLNNLKSWKPHLVDLQRQRSAALKERWAARERVATIRDAFGRRATTILREALTDLQVSLKYDRSAHSPDAASLIIEAMGWRTNQQPRAARLVEDMTLPVLLEAVNKKNVKAFLGITTSEGVEVFDREDALAIIEKLSAPAIRFALERAELHDLPRLKVARMVPDGKGGSRPLIRDFAKLSLGQQQSVLLALMLSSDSNQPLIIDQPEDNLDGEFIYSTLVPVLRRAKERRQVIIVTHNPNVAVLGDAELIIVMKAMSDRGEIVSRGSIDHRATCDAACAILEGAREAFLRRAKMYGVRFQLQD